MTLEIMATCIGPPPLPPNKKMATQRKNANSSSTYLSFKDPLDEIIVIGTEEIVEDKSNVKSPRHQQHSCSKLKGLPKKCKHSRCTEGDSGSDLQRLNRQPSLKFCKRKEPDEAVPLKTFSMKCEDLTKFGDAPFATVRSARAGTLRQHSFSRSSFHSKAYPAKLSLLKSSSEGDIALALEKESSMISKDAGVGQKRLNKCLKALSGSWKNLLILGGMSRPPKPLATAKRVPPPAVPDAYGSAGVPPPVAPQTVACAAAAQHRHSGSSFGSSQGYASSEDAAFLQPPDTPGGGARDDHSDYGSTVSGVSGMSGTSGMSGKSPGVPSSVPAFTFPPPTQPLTHKAAVYYHHQLALQEDQGIDMTQSPGRDSPGSSSGSAGSCSRHSTASVDSGRASARGPSQQGLPGVCCDHSIADTVRAMMCQGVQDHEIIHTWLSELRMEEYVSLFVTAGYDIPTMTRMTPEDLTAVGVKKPNHRKRLKAELANLNVTDSLPDYIPGSLDEWLRLLRLEEYGPALVSQGYRSVQDVTQLTWEDLEDIGIVRLGHQKKILLAIKRVKDIRSGKRTFSNPACIDLRMTPHHTQDVTLLPLSANYNPMHVHTSQHAYQQPWEVQQTRSISASYHSHIAHPKLHYVDDLVPIQVRQPRGKSLESLEDAERTTHLTFSPEAQTFYYPSGNQIQPTWRRSYDDGDITPTNEATILGNYEGGGTLPRPRGLVRPRPVAKISATAKPPVRENVIFQDINEKSPKYIMDGFQYQPDKLAYAIQAQHLRPVYAVSPQLGKKMPPEPPKRQSSNPGIDQVTSQLDHMGMGRPFSPSFCYQYGANFGQTIVEIHPEKQKSLPLSLPAYPSSDSLSVSLDSSGILPPPPAPSSPLRYQNQTTQEEHELVGKLVMQSRNGSDASFKSSSSTESDSLPFANDNAGTIKQNRGQMAGRPHTVDYGRSLSALPPRHPSSIATQECKDAEKANASQSTEPADVLNDIGNMLANLTDELDAMLEEEKRQGLAEG